jgi:hypothetical protein
MAARTILNTQMTETSPSRDLTEKKFWSPSAPEAVRHAFRAGNEAEGWAAWADYVRRRSEPKPLGELLPGKQSPLVWALPEGLEETTLALVTQLSRLPAHRRINKAGLDAILPTWHATSGNGRLSVGLALEALAFAHALPRLAEAELGEIWRGLLERLVAIVVEAQTLPLVDDPLTHQLLAGELGWTLAYLFPEIQPCRQLLKPSRATLANGLAELLDSEGELHGRHIRHARSLAACWTRSRAIGDAMAERGWNARTETLYQQFVRQLLRLTRPDGTHAFARPADKATGRRDEELVAAALGLVQSSEDTAIAALVLRGAKRPGRQGKKRKLPEAVSHSEWASMAVMRREWDKQAPRLVVDYHGPSVQLELASGGETLWSGPWDVEIRQDGQRLEPVSSWSEICWYTDEQIDYLELEADFAGGLRVQRHLAFAYEDGFLLVADSVLGGRPAELEYRSRLPLVERVRFEPAEETHEGFLLGAKRRALVLPLALPEWRCDSRPGALTSTEQGLELHQLATGTALFAPLFVDIDPHRIRRPFTWRQLTVAENLEIQPRDVAVGYRVMSGDQQWLLYRSLAPTGNRTVLGHNLISQMLVAQFGRDGEVEALVEIE